MKNDWLCTLLTALIILLTIPVMPLLFAAIWAVFHILTCSRGGWCCWGTDAIVIITLPSVVFLHCLLFIRVYLKATGGSMASRGRIVWFLCCTAVVIPLVLFAGRGFMYDMRSIWVLQFFAVMLASAWVSALIALMISLIVAGLKQYEDKRALKLAFFVPIIPSVIYLMRK